MWWEESKLVLVGKDWDKEGRKMAEGLCFLAAGDSFLVMTRDNDSICGSGWVMTSVGCDSRVQLSQGVGDLQQTRMQYLSSI